jgi:hypothetical protein
MCDQINIVRMHEAALVELDARAVKYLTEHQGTEPHHWFAGGEFARPWSVADDGDTRTHHELWGTLLGHSFLLDRRP